MSELSSVQPDGTPCWIDLGIHDLDRAREFYGALFGWEFQTGPAEAGYYTMCTLRGRQVAALAPNQDPDASEFWWNVYFATADCDGHAKAVVEAGGEVVLPPMDVMDAGRMALVRDAVGAQFGLWQGRAHIGAEIVNEPGALLRNDLITPDPERAREFYRRVFGYTLDANPDMPELDFTFLRRPDGHEIGGIVGAPEATSSAWNVLFQVEDADAAAEAARGAGATVLRVEDNPYARLATLRDPFGAELVVGSHRAG